MLKEKICAYCKRSYEPSNYNQRFCSSSCKNCFSSSKRLREKEERKNPSKKGLTPTVDTMPINRIETAKERAMYKAWEEILGLGKSITTKD